jgi:hypothetical protein
MGDPNINFQIGSQPGGRRSGAITFITTKIREEYMWNKHHNTRPGLLHMTEPFKGS